MAGGALSARLRVPSARGEDGRSAGAIAAARRRRARRRLRWRRRGALRRPRGVSTAAREASRAERTVALGEAAALVRCVGAGSPTVIVEAGDADTSASYDVPPTPSARRRGACAYDRAGLGATRRRCRRATRPRRSSSDLAARAARPRELAPPYVTSSASGGGYDRVGYAGASGRDGRTVASAPSRRDPRPAAGGARSRPDDPAAPSTALLQRRARRGTPAPVGDVPVAVVTARYREAAEASRPSAASPTSRAGSCQPAAEQRVRRLPHDAVEDDQLAERDRVLDVRARRLVTTLSEVTPAELRNRPCGGRYEDIVAAIGNTPLVELKRFSPKPGVRIWAKLESREPDRLGQGPRRARAHRGRRGAGPHPARPDDPRADVGQHRHLAGDDLLAQGLPAEGRDAGQRDARAHAAAADVRRGDRLLARRPGLERRRRDGARDGRGATPSYYMPYQYGNEANPNAHYNGTAKEILEELDEITRVRRRPRHRRHAHGQRPALQGGARRRA